MAPHIRTFLSRLSFSRDNSNIKAQSPPPRASAFPLSELGPSSSYGYGRNNTDPTITASDTSTGSTHPIRAHTRLDTRRESYLKWIHDRYPTFEPRDDYEIINIVENRYSGPVSEIRRLLDNQLLLDIMFAAGLEIIQAIDRMHPAEVERVMQSVLRPAKTILDAPGSLGGAKPGPDTPNVFCRAIPDSPYAIRLFPGLLAQNEWYMDFVDAWTGEAVEAPSGFQICSARNSGTSLPYLWGAITVVQPVGQFPGGPDALDSEAGVETETFKLRDGQVCLLRRKGHRDVLFTVPMRAVGWQLVQAQADHLDFPQMV